MNAINNSALETPLYERLNDVSSGKLIFDDHAGYGVTRGLFADDRNVTNPLLNKLGLEGLTDLTAENFDEQEENMDLELMQM